MIDEVLMLLANLGALKAEKAIPIRQLKEMPSLKGRRVEEEVFRLKSMGYVTLVGDSVYLTPSGILRAFSYFS